MAKKICPAAALVLAVCLSLNPAGCRSTVDDFEVLEGDYSGVRISRISIASETSLKLEFSRPVRIDSAQIFSNDEERSEIPAQIEFDPEGKSALVKFASRTEIGKGYILEGRVLDNKGNSLTFSSPFIGYNANPAKIILSEVRVRYGSSSSGAKKFHRSQYAEVYVLEGGNLCGLEIASAKNGDGTKFTLPAVEVKAGEYVVLHLSSFPGEKSYSEADSLPRENETGSNLSLSRHPDSAAGARDLWSPSETGAAIASSYSSGKAIADAVFIRNSFTDEILDSLLFSSPAESWEEAIPKKSMTAFNFAMKEIERSGTWQGGLDLQCAANSAGASATKAVTRTNIRQIEKLWKSGAYRDGAKIENTKANWSVRDCTMGKQN